MLCLSSRIVYTSYNADPASKLVSTQIQKFIFSEASVSKLDGFQLSSGK